MSIKIGRNGDGKEEKSVKHEIRIQRKPNPIGFFLTCKILLNQMEVKADGEKGQSYIGQACRASP
jgi:hypothetical protein